MLLTLPYNLNTFLNGFQEHNFLMFLDSLRVELLYILEFTIEGPIRLYRMIGDDEGGGEKLFQQLKYNWQVRRFVLGRLCGTAVESLLGLWIGGLGTSAVMLIWRGFVISLESSGTILTLY